MKTTSKDAKMRWYDGTGTPYYLEVDLDVGDFNAPIGAPTAEEIMVLDRNKASADMHFIKGGDDKLMGEFNITFSIFVRDDVQFGYILDWIDAMNDGLSTTVNSNTLVSTENDSQRDGANNNPSFADSNKSRFNIEYLINTSGTDRGWKYMECFVDRGAVNFAEAEDGNTLAITAMCYGTVTRITSFTAGTSVEA